MKKYLIPILAVASVLTGTVAVAAASSGSRSASSAPTPAIAPAWCLARGGNAVTTWTQDQEYAFLKDAVQR